MQPVDHTTPAESSPPALPTRPAVEMQSAVQSPFTIGELREMIFNNLDTRDLLNAAVTSTDMQCMLQVPSIQRQLWKLPVPVKAGEDPHFQPLTDEQAKVLLRNKLTIPETTRRNLWTFFDTLQAEREARFFSLTA